MCTLVTRVRLEDALTKAKLAPYAKYEYSLDARTEAITTMTKCRVALLDVSGSVAEIYSALAEVSVKIMTRYRDGIETPTEFDGAIAIRSSYFDTYNKFITALEHSVVKHGAGECEAEALVTLLESLPIVYGIVNFKLNTRLAEST